MMNAQTLQRPKVERAVYNIAFSQQDGRFNAEIVQHRLREHSITIGHWELEGIFNKWLQKGRIFKSANGYIINSSF